MDESKIVVLLMNNPRLHGISKRFITKMKLAGYDIPPLERETSNGGLAKVHKNGWFETSKKS